MTRGPLADLSVTAQSTIRQAIECIDRAARLSIALVVDADGRLLNTITDGDVRRGILAGLPLEAPVERLLEIKRNTPHPTPVTAAFGTSPAALLRLMQDEGVRQMPLLDSAGRPLEIVILADLLPAKTSGLRALVMAGGRGERLRPLTDELPKPMLPLGGRPVLERLVRQLKEVGVEEVFISTHYLPEKIVQHFGDGSEIGVRLTYIREDKPLGTAGAVSLLGDSPGRLFVINGDIVTDVDFASMQAFHVDNRAEMTVGVRNFSLNVPYGVVQHDGVEVRGVDEKPELKYFVSAGIYLLEPGARALVPAGVPFPMTDLIERVVAERRRVVAFPIREYWVDIGLPKDYAQAQEDERLRIQAEPRERKG